MSEITITLTSLITGASESISVSPKITVDELMEWAVALLSPPDNFVLFKDGKPVMSLNQTLEQCGIVHGDLLAVQTGQQRTQTAPAVTGTASGTDSGGLDFSSLIGGAVPPSSGGTLNFSNLIASAPSRTPPPPVYYEGMSLHDAMMHNPHPQTFVELLMEHISLFKELNYHQPLLAEKLRGKSVADATNVWREELTKGSIRGAMAQTERLVKENTMRKKLAENPNDPEAKAYFEKLENQKLIMEQYRTVMNDYPESMGKILMLYIDCHVNGTALKAFVDSGAQSTIMTKQCTDICGISHLIDTRFAGQAVGVGTGTIIGRIHLADMKIGEAYFPITITVMEKMSSNNDMKFLLGLDNLKRFQCQLDLERNVLRFKLGPGQSMETPFLHEKDLGEDQGGTQGFDAEKANREIMELHKKHEENGEDDDDMAEAD
jgi:hypothetical protein